MTTPLQELIEQLNNVKPQDFCSIETIKGWAESLLEKEKEVMCDFAFTARLDDYLTPDELFDKTFNTKEK